jgi:hypothetical protein
MTMIRPCKEKFSGPSCQSLNIAQVKRPNDFYENYLQMPWHCTFSRKTLKRRIKLSICLPRELPRSTTVWHRSLLPVCHSAGLARVALGRTGGERVSRHSHTQYQPRCHFLNLVVDTILGRGSTKPTQFNSEMEQKMRQKLSQNIIRLYC